MEGDITQVRSRALAADEPFLPRELIVQNLQDPTKALDIACAGLGVGLDDGPVKDALEDRSLRGGLELEPLLHEVLLWEGGEGDALLGVVLVEDVIHDRAGL